MATEKKLLDSYSISTDNIEVDVNIVYYEGDFVKTYELILPRFEEGTKALLDFLKEDIRAEESLKISKLTRPEDVKRLKKKFAERIKAVLKAEKINVSEKEQRLLTSTILTQMLGLEKLEYALNDPNLEEIVINSAEEPLWVYHRNHAWLKTNIRVLSEVDTANYASIVARRIGRQINVLSPLLDAHLLTGERVNATLQPISNHGNTLTIRKARENPWTVPEFISNKTVSSEVMAVIWMAMQYELNMLVSGGTASGKTSFLNVCMPFLQPNHRVISIEDTRELQLPDFLHWVPMVTREPNAEGKGGIKMLDLLVNSLRMRPDRIVVGEVRRQQEAEVMFEGMHTGHSVYSTVHAETAAQTIRRLVSPPIDIPANLLEAVHLNLVMFRNRRTGYRRAFQLAEFVPTGEEGRETISANILYRWKPSSDKVEKYSEGIRFFDDLSLHTAFTKKEINDEIQEKKNILDWMVKKKVIGLNPVGTALAKYYLDKDLVLKTVEQDKDPKYLLER